MLEDDIERDGYGVPFSPEVQRRHLESVLRQINQPKEESKHIEQQPWKDKPAGQYSKGSGV